MPINWMEHKGKKILYIDYSNQTKEDTIKMLDDVKEVFLKLDEKVLVLDNFEGCFASDEFMKKAKEYGKEYFAPKKKKAAALGINGIKKILLSAFNTFSSDKLVPFDTKEEALEYLVKE